AAAEAELARHGHAATAMSGIARRAGVSVGTLYNYFNDKGALLATLLRARRAQLLARLDEAIAAHQTMPFAVRLEGVVDTVLRVFESHRDVMRIVFGNEFPPSLRSKSGGGSKEAAKPPGAHFVDRLRPVMESGVREGVLAVDGADLYAP